jgi:hypothetical protein
MEAQHKSLQQEQEAAEFEKLQAKFGFSDKVGWHTGVLLTEAGAQVWLGILELATGQDCAARRAAGMCSSWVTSCPPAAVICLQQRRSEKTHCIACQASSCRA